MEKIGSPVTKKVLVYLGAFIVVGGFVLALFSGASYGLFGSLSPAGSSTIQQGASNPSFVVGQNPGTSPPDQTTIVVSTSTATLSSTSGYVDNSSYHGSAGVSAGTGTGSIEFSSQVALESSTPSQTASGVVALAYSVGGYVAYQSTGPSYADVVIRVPASQYNSVLSKVQKMGTVTGLTSNSNDVRVQYTDLNATLASLKTEQSALLRLLNKSSTINSTLAIENQLQSVDQQVNQVESQILQTTTLIALSTIEVTVSETAQKSHLSVVMSATPTNGTQPLSVTFNAIVKGGAPPYLVNYNFGDGTATQGQIIVHTYFGAGSYRVLVSVTDNNGTVASAAATVKVQSGPSQVGAPDFFGSVANLFVSVVEGIVEVAVVVLPLAAVGMVVLIPFRKRSRSQKGLKQSP